MSAKIEYRHKEIYVYLSGEIDHHSASLIRNGIDDAIIKKRPKYLVLNFKDVSFMDSSAIGLIMGRYKLMRSINGKLIVDDLSPSYIKIMRLAGLERLCELKESEVF